MEVTVPVEYPSNRVVSSKVNQRVNNYAVNKFVPLFVVGVLVFDSTKL